MVATEVWWPVSFVRFEVGGVAASATMCVLVQRVSSASVSPHGQGLLALVGVTHSDNADKAGRLAETLWQLRILDDERTAADLGAPRTLRL